MKPKDETTDTTQNDVVFQHIRTVLSDLAQKNVVMCQYKGLYQNSFLSIVETIQKINYWISEFSKNPDTDVLAYLQAQHSETRQFLNSPIWQDVSDIELKQIAARIFQLSLISVDYCDADEKLTKLLSESPDQMSKEIQELIEMINMYRDKIVHNCNPKSKIDNKLLSLYPTRMVNPTIVIPMQ